MWLSNQSHKENKIEMKVAELNWGKWTKINVLIFIISEIWKADHFWCLIAYCDKLKFDLFVLWISQQNPSDNSQITLGKWGQYGMKYQIAR